MKETNGKRVAIYARVSTADQTTDNQLLDLRAYAERRGWAIKGEYVDEGVSGVTESRPSLDKLMDAAKKRRIDAVLVWRLDRLGRTTKHLVLTLDELRVHGVEFVSYQENLDSGTPLGRAVFGIFAVLAEMERELIAERVRAGLRRARRQGRRLGRPPVDVDLDCVLQLRGQGLSIRAIAKQIGVPKSTVARVLKTV